MTYSLAIDPGRAGLGWAVGLNGQLVDCGLARAPKGPRDFAQASISQVASNAISKIPGHLYTLGAVERMLSIPGSSAMQAKANDLLDLQAIGNLVIGALVPAHNVHHFYPAQWMMGSPPTHANHLRIRNALAMNELVVLGECSRAALTGAKGRTALSLEHNIWDAVGILLHLHGRLHARRTA